MWRLWTRGWGPRSWWYWVREATPRAIAMRLPRRIALWAFIRVHAAEPNGPGNYASAYDHWTRGDAR